MDNVKLGSVSGNGGFTCGIVFVSEDVATWILFQLIFTISWDSRYINKARNNPATTAKSKANIIFSLHGLCIPLDIYWYVYAGLISLSIGIYRYHGNEEDYGVFAWEHGRCTGEGKKREVFGNSAGNY